MDNFLLALTQVLDPQVLLYVLLGTVLGVLVGSLPGLTATMAVSLLVSFTFGMSFTHAIALLMGVYFGGVYGGSLSAIVLHIPGTPSSIMTALDGHPLARRGEAGRAIGISVTSSVFGGMFSIVFLIIGAQLITMVALKFSSPEYFALGVFGLSIIASISGQSLTKGLIATSLGLLVAMVGMDPVTGVSRFTFGRPELLGGFNFIPMMIGLFGMTEVLRQLAEKRSEQKAVRQQVKKVTPELGLMKRILPVLLRSSAIGTFIGALPGAGPTIASFVAYNDLKTTSKQPEKLGTGVPEGVAAPEAANNAACGGALMPLITLGVPGDSVTAILIGAFMIHGMQPGPLLFQNHADVVYSLYMLAFIALIFLFLVGIYGAKYYAKILSIDTRVLYPVIILFCVVGSYAISNSLWDVGVMFAFGIIGYIMFRFEIPITPMILGIVLGPMIETNLRTAMIQMHGDFIAMMIRPVSLIFWVLTLISLSIPLFRMMKARKSKA